MYGVRYPSNQNFGQHAQQGMVVGIGKETKGYRVYLPKDRKTEAEEESKDEQTPSAGGSGAASARSATNRANGPSADGDRAASTGEAMSRVRMPSDKVTQASEAERGDGQERELQEEAGPDDENSVVKPDPKNYGEAVRSWQRLAWLKAIAEELEAIAVNGVWKIVRRPPGAHVLHDKWGSKRKRGTDGLIEPLKVRLVACGNEQVFGVNYSVTFAAVIDMSSVKLILVLAEWQLSMATF
ncbi:hypothetical protein PC119_g22862 [Phytophthora cactorum]|nr:hypothetical protein PC114_g19675 [Phytophthora cactorum]KAG2973620.1 hypothetical protein PC119_g22862 [Phytophthora cactorum]